MTENTKMQQDIQSAETPQIKPEEKLSEETEALITDDSFACALELHQNGTVSVHLLHMSYEDLGQLFTPHFAQQIAVGIAAQIESLKKQIDQAESDDSLSKS